MAKRKKKTARLHAADSSVERSGDLDALLVESLDRVLEVLGFESGAIYLKDSIADGLQTACHRGLSEAIQQVMTEGFITAEAMESEETVLIDDLHDFPSAPSEIVDDGYRSVASVPLISQEKVEGVLAMVSHREIRPRQRDIDWLQSIGREIGANIENARLLQAAQRRAQQLRVIGELGRRMTSILGTDELLREMAKVIRDAFDYYQVGFGLIEGEEVVYKAGAGVLWDDPRLKFEPPRLKIGEEGISGWVASKGEPVVVPDVTEEPKYVEMRGSEARSELTVPIQARDQVIGILDVQSDQLDAFDESDLAVLQSIAHQAGVAIHNATLFEAEQKRADELNALYTTLSDITAELELPSLLEAIVERAAGLLNATGGELGLYDHADQQIRVVVSYNLGGDYAGTIHKRGEGAMGAVAHTGQPLVIDDYQHWEGSLSQYSDIRAVLATPLEVGGRLVGVFTTVTTDPDRKFNSSDLHLLSIFARQAAIAIENARLYEDTARRLAGLTALQETTRAVASTLELSELLNLITEQATTLLQAGGGMINLVDWELREDETVAGAGLGRTAVGFQGSLDGSLSGWVTLHNQPVISNQAQTDTRVDRRALSRLVDDTNEPIQTFALAPLTTKDQVMGTLVVMHKQGTRGEFDQADLDLLAAFANQAATAIENANLYEQAQQLAVLEERQRLARDLHDSVSQTLFSASLVAEVVPQLWNKDPSEGQRRLEELRQLTRGAVAETRALLMELRPDTLTKVGLDDLLRQLAEAVIGRARLPVELRVEGQRSLPPDVQIALYRIAQEALNNAARHANPTRIDIDLHASVDNVKLRVKDDGRGFDPSDVTPEHLGLGIMRERAERIGATLEIESRVDGGTQVSVVWVDTGHKSGDG